MTLPTTVDETLAHLAEGDYVAERSLATAVFLTLRMRRPLFLEGEAGVGKTEVARVLARVLGRRLVRLQCYEGLDVASAVYEWKLSAADDPDPARRDGRKRRSGRVDRIGRGGHLHSPLPHRAPPPPGPGFRPGRRAGAAHRRARPRGRAVRGVPAGTAGRLPDHDSRTRHRRRRGTTRGGHHLQPYPRDPRRHQAPLLLPLGGLSRRCTGTRNPPGAGAGDRGGVEPRGRRLRAEPAWDGSVQGTRGGRDDRLGPGP